MKIQCDTQKRVVALSNLEAMCDRVSGVCRRFQVVKVTSNRVHVEYSNPDEYGNENPMTAVFPSWQTKGWNHDGKDTYIVLGDILNVINDTWQGEGWQAFEVLRDCPELFRQNPDSKEWKSREEWEKINASSQPKP